MKNIFSAIVITFIIAVGCSNSQNATPINEDIISVSSGQSFGMCIGNCTNELIITGNNVILQQVNRSRGIINDTIQHSDISRTTAINSALSKISKKDFLALDDIYGCPDCADGGSEWLEVVFKDEKIKRVTFEYGGNVKGLEEITNILREQRLSLIEKYR